jgi:hypothetical protein
MRTRGGAGGGEVGTGAWVTAAGTAEGLAEAVLCADAGAGAVLCVDAGAGADAACESVSGAPPQPTSAQHPASALAAASARLAMVTDISDSRLSALADANMKRSAVERPGRLN